MIQKEAWYKEALGLEVQLSELVKRVEGGDPDALREIFSFWRRTGQFPDFLPSFKHPEKMYPVFEEEVKREAGMVPLEIRDRLIGLSMQVGKRPDLPMPVYLIWFHEMYEGTYSNTALGRFFSLMFLPKTFDGIVADLYQEFSPADFRVAVNISPFGEADLTGTPLYYFQYELEPVVDQALNNFRGIGYVPPEILQEFFGKTHEWETEYLPQLKQQMQEWASPDFDPEGLKAQPEAVAWREENPRAWERLKAGQRRAQAVATWIGPHGRISDQMRQLTTDTRELLVELHESLVEFGSRGLLTYPHTLTLETLDERLSRIESLARGLGMQ